MRKCNIGKCGCNHATFGIREGLYTLENVFLAVLFKKHCSSSCQACRRRKHTVPFSTAKLRNIYCQYSTVQSLMRNLVIIILINDIVWKRYVVCNKMWLFGSPISSNHTIKAPIFTIYNCHIFHCCIHTHYLQKSGLHNLFLYYSKMLKWTVTPSVLATLVH